MAVICSASAWTIPVLSHGSRVEMCRWKMPTARMFPSRHPQVRPAQGTGAGAGARLPTRRRRVHQSPRALFGGDGGRDSKSGQQEKKFISKEDEPEQYWQTADEKAGKGPMSSPLPYIAILGLLLPFVILGVAFANKWIKIPGA